MKQLQLIEMHNKIHKILIGKYVTCYMHNFAQRTETYSGTTLIRLWFNSNIALNRTKFEVPGQALYTSIGKSIVSSNVDILEE